MSSWFHSTNGRGGKNQIWTTLPQTTTTKLTYSYMYATWGDMMLAKSKIQKLQRFFFFVGSKNSRASFLSRI
jgi:hypothetical protein